MFCLFIARIDNYVVPGFKYYARIQLDKKIEAVVKGKVQILHGTIGTGKSSAAVNFIHNARDKFAVIWCVDCAKGGESIRSDLSDLAKKLNVQAVELFHTIKKKAEKEDVLFFLDNLDEKQADEFNELWKIKDAVYIIATTNNASLNLPNAEKILVDTFDEAVQFLKEAKEAREENSEDDVKKLCEYFSWNVLGLTSAKSYITDENESIQSYLKMLHDKEAASIVRETEQEKRKLRILYAAVRACLENVSKDQFKALAVMSVIGHDNIPEFLLSSVFSSKSAAARAANLNKLHSSLRLKSLVHVTNENEVRFFSFHRFTQSVVSDLLSEDEDLRRELIYKVAGMLVKYFNKDNRYRKDASMLKILAHHAEVFLQTLKKEKMDDRTLIASARLSELVGFAYTQGAQRRPDWLFSSRRHFRDSESLLHRLCGITEDDLKDLTKSQESKCGKSSPLGITDFHTSIAEHLFQKLNEKSSELSVSTVHELAFSRTINSDDLSLFPEDIKDRLKEKENSFEPLSEEDVNLLVHSGVAYCVDDYRKLFLPELYVSLLYSFGRNYFYFSDKLSVEQPSDYVDRLKLAHCIAREIAKEMKPGHAVIHEYLTQSNALLYFLVNPEVTCKGGGLKVNKEHCQDMKIAIECYRKLMQEERQFFEMGILKKEKNEKFSQMVCLHQILQCRITLMSPEMTESNDEPNELIKNGVSECKQLLALVQTDKDVKGKVSKGLQNFSKYLNIVGEFCLAMNCNDLLHQAWRLYIDSARNAEVKKELTGRFYVEALVGLADVFSRFAEQCFVACKISNLQLEHCDSYRVKFRKVLFQQQSRITEIKRRNSLNITGDCGYTVRQNYTPYIVDIYCIISRSCPLNLVVYSVYMLFCHFIVVCI